MSGFQVRYRLPALPVSGVKKPAPVAIGTALACASSVGARLTGRGRGGNSSSISGIDPGYSLLVVWSVRVITNIPRAHKPSKASQICEFKAKACRKLSDAISVILPFKAMVPDRHRKAASSGNIRAGLLLVEATWIINIHYHIHIK
jgi:hypothetical protein